MYDWLKNDENCIEELQFFYERLEKFDNFEYIINKLLKGYLEEKEFNAEKFEFNIDLDLNSLVGVEKTLVIFNSIEDMWQCFGEEFPVFTKMFFDKCVVAESSYLDFVLEFLMKEEVKEIIESAIGEYFSENIGIDLDVFSYKPVVTTTFRGNNNNFSLSVKCYITSVYYFLSEVYDKYFKNTDKVPLPILELFVAVVQLWAIHDALLLIDDIIGYDHFSIEYSNWINMSLQINQVMHLKNIPEIIIDALESSIMREIPLLKRNIENIDYIEQDIYNFLSAKRGFIHIAKKLLKNNKIRKKLEKIYLDAFSDTMTYKYIKTKIIIKKGDVVVKKIN